MKTHWLAIALASCAAAFAGCSPGTMVRCALTDLMTPEPGPQPADTRAVAAAAETTPVPDACDAADDPAVWVDEADPEASLIVATNKLRGLVVYGLDGAVVSTNDVGRVNNVDLRDGVDIGGEDTIVVGATNRTTWTIDVLGLDPDSGALTPLLDAPISPDFDEDPYGLCLYRSAATGDMYVFANDQGGAVEQWRLDPGDTGLTGTRVRSWAVGSQTEGCVADDANGWLFIGEEEVGIWRYRAEPGLSTAERVAVDRVGVGEPTRRGRSRRRLSWQPHLRRLRPRPAARRGPVDLRGAAPAAVPTTAFWWRRARATTPTSSTTAPRRTPTAGDLPRRRGRSGGRRRGHRRPVRTPAEPLSAVRAEARLSVQEQVVRGRCDDHRFVFGRLPVGVFSTHEGRDQAAHRAGSGGPSAELRQCRQGRPHLVSSPARPASGSISYPMGLLVVQDGVNLAR